MSDSALAALQIQPDTADFALAHQQVRFNTLVQDVAFWRAALAGWRDRMDRYHQAVEPVHRALHAAWRQWVFALADAGLQPGLTRGERAQLRDLLLDAAAQLLAIEDDAEIAALVRIHADEPPQPRAVDPAATSPNPTPDDPADAPMLDWEQQAEAAAQRREEAAARRRSAAAARRRKQAQQEVSQSLRDVYRRLASVLHPDREQDPQQRERKTALMQQANQAYADDNLLALLELQLQAEQIDAAHLAA
ncbi:MAG: J domain-containing protein, partial [Comamonadaceae bacterium]